MENFLIPIPSLETQEKIVKILDKFTSYITALQAELQKEYQARKKQYEYYRSLLFSKKYLHKISKKIDELENNKKLKEFSLEHIIKIKHGKDWKQLGTGIVPVYGSGGKMNLYVDQYLYNKPTVLIPRKGSIENVFYLEKPFWNIDTIFYTEINENKILPKYFYYFIENYNIKSLSTNFTRPTLTKDILKKIRIKLPHKKIQDKIVKILDTFQALINDISEGLLKEIELRQKQYEYYREKLLHFPKELRNK
ncbi:MAG: restriction endonuclease subunit S [Planctomycetes bacterium]|nr:restriction endonuclease subunit S [Planctomycetota bacterium]